MAVFTSSIDITNNGVYDLRLKNGTSYKKMSSDLNGKMENIQNYLQSNLPETYSSLPTSLPHGKLIICDNQLYFGNSDGIPTKAGGDVESSDLNLKADKHNTVLTGSISMGRIGSIGENSIAIGDSVEASGNQSHAEGYRTIASEERSHAEGTFTTASGISSHAEGYLTIASGEYSHAEGYMTEASGKHSHAEGGAETDATKHTVSSGLFSHAEGNQTTSSSTGSHSEGNETTASGIGSHAEGVGTTASDWGDHAEGTDTKASGSDSHAEGHGSKASKRSAHAEGEWTGATNYGAHSEGSFTIASGEHSHAEGIHTEASNYASHVCGHLNKAMTNGGNFENKIGDVFVIGNGIEINTDPLVLRSNALRVTYAGETYGLSNFNSSGADYAEYFEWEDGNPNNEDRIGYFVTLNNDKINIANIGDYVLGIVSGQPCVIGNADEDWLGRWEHDEYGRFVKEYLESEDVEISIDELSEEEIDKLRTNPRVKIKDDKYYRTTSKVVNYETPSWRYKPNPEYDNTQQYIERKDRSEWDAIGMVGVLSVKEDGTCKVNGFCQVAENGIATSADKYIPGQTYRVIKRINENVIKVIFR